MAQFAVQLYQPQIEHDIKAPAKIPKSQAAMLVKYKAYIKSLGDVFNKLDIMESKNVYVNTVKLVPLFMYCFMKIRVPRQGDQVYYPDKKNHKVPSIDEADEEVDDIENKNPRSLKERVRLVELDLKRTKEIVSHGLTEDQRKLLLSPIVLTPDGEEGGDDDVKPKASSKKKQEKKPIKKKKHRVSYAGMLPDEEANDNEDDQDEDDDGDDIESEEDAGDDDDEHTGDEKDDDDDDDDDEEEEEDKSGGYDNKQTKKRKDTNPTDSDGESTEKKKKAKTDPSMVTVPTPTKATDNTGEGTDNVDRADQPVNMESKGDGAYESAAEITMGLDAETAQSISETKPSAMEEKHL
jgi:hypothetical protein